MTAQQRRWHSASLWVLVAAMLCICSTSSMAQTTSVRVYRSTDANGSVHFSDQPPATVQQAEVIELSVTSPRHDPAVQERQQAAREVTERIVADREQRAAQRQRVYRAGQVSQDAREQGMVTAPQAALPPVYPWVAWPVAPQHPRYLPPRRELPPGGYWGRVPHAGSGDWSPPQRNPYPYSVIRSRYRGAAGEVFNPR